MRKREVVKQRLAINTVNFTGFLPSFQIPALVIVGNHMEIGVKLCKKIADLIPDCKFEIIENSFDPSNLCQPEIFNQIVHTFISEP